VIKLFGGRAASALVGISVLAFGSSANAQAPQVAPVSYNLNSTASSSDADASKSVGDTATDVATALVKPVVAATTVVANAAGSIFQAQPAQSVTVQLAPSVAKEAAWLYKGGWPLYALVDKFATNAPLDEQTNCLATAVYFEARGETVEGQLAVAKVVMNRAASGKYPTDWCSVVKQPYQFSFVRHGEFPAADTNCQAWKKAEAVAELAVAKVVPTLSDDVLWYHADYVAPSWRNNLQEVQKIGAHIFYRA
jgi:spore germination cell wall hydrolase CwlJ-like protein